MRVAGRVAVCWARSVCPFRWSTHPCPLCSGARTLCYLHYFIGFLPPWFCVGFASRRHRRTAASLPTLPPYTHRPPTFRLFSYYNVFHSIFFKLCSLPCRKWTRLPARRNRLRAPLKTGPWMSAGDETWPAVHTTLGSGGRLSPHEEEVPLLAVQFCIYTLIF